MFLCDCDSVGIHSALETVLLPKRHARLIKRPRIRTSSAVSSFHYQHFFLLILESCFAEPECPCGLKPLRDQDIGSCASNEFSSGDMSFPALELGYDACVQNNRTSRLFREQTFGLGRVYKPSVAAISLSSPSTALSQNQSEREANVCPAASKNSESACYVCLRLERIFF
jgi:hypothetical protein